MLIIKIGAKAQIIFPKNTTNRITSSLIIVVRISIVQICIPSVAIIILILSGRPKR
jgi:hypothetical protein